MAVNVLNWAIVLQIIYLPGLSLTLEYIIHMKKIRVGLVLLQNRHPISGMIVTPDVVLPQVIKRLESFLYITQNEG
jgi:hypothetical protein